MNDSGTLIVRLGAIGDTVLTVPLIQTVIDRFSDAPVWLVGSSYAPPLLKRVRGLTGILTIDDPDVMSLFDESGRWDDRLVERIGVPTRAFVALANYSDMLVSLARIGVGAVVAASPVPPEGVHVADHLARLAGGSLPAVPALTVSEVDLETVRSEFPTLSGAIVLMPGAGGIPKRWDGFASLCNHLQDEARVVVLGGPADRQALDPYRGVAEVVDSIPITLLPAALSLARLVVANDSGPGHIAAAVGSSLVSIFTVMDPRTWAPRGTQVEVLFNPTVERVLAAVRCIG